MTQHATTPGSRGDVKTGATVDAIVIGAGFGGLSAAYHLREAGLQVQAFEKGGDVGGTWYWNRYPGARTDSEAAIYRLNFFDDLFGPWKFREKFPAQPEVLEYLTAVADKLDLRGLYAFSTKVTRVIWNDSESRWHVETEDGRQWVAKYVVGAAGIMSAPIKPEIAGLGDFQGEVFHTAEWPHEHPDFSGKRVAVFGTGSSGIQVLPEIAAQAAQVTVFQRTPNYSVPMKNVRLGDEDHASFEDAMQDIRGAVRAHPFSMHYPFAGRVTTDVSDEERQAIFEEAWEKGGFRFLIESFDDIAVDKAANDLVSEFLRGKIRELVHDPETAKMLSPEYPYSVKRPPSGTDFFEAFNRETVDLVDLRRTPITKATANGLVLEDTERGYDAIVFATGFDFLTGALYRMDVRGRDDVTLQERWKEELAIYLSFALNGFPNLFLIGGPLYPGGNWPTTAEQVSQFVSTLIARAEAASAERIEVKADVERDWVDHCNDVARQTLMYTYGTDANAYGFGANVEGKLQAVHFYMGGAHIVFDRMDEEAAGGYPGFALTAADGAVVAPQDASKLHDVEAEAVVATNV